MEKKEFDYVGQVRDAVQMVENSVMEKDQVRAITTVRNPWPLSETHGQSLISFNTDLGQFSGFFSSP